MSNEKAAADKPRHEYYATLASTCQGAAANLTYNEGKAEASAKHVLIEASAALDSCSVRVSKKKDGLLLVNARGHARFMTWRERIAYALLGGRTIIAP